MRTRPRRESHVVEKPPDEEVGMPSATGIGGAGPLPHPGVDRLLDPDGLTPPPQTPDRCMSYRLRIGFSIRDPNISRAWYRWSRSLNGIGKTQLRNESDPGGHTNPRGLTCRP